MIDRVEFHNFKALRDVSLDLERLTVLVGPNASGKTSVLQGIFYLAELAESKPREEVLGSGENVVCLTTRGQAPRMAIMCFRNGCGRLLELQHDGTHHVNSFTFRSIQQDFLSREQRDENAERSPVPTVGPPTVGPAALLRLEADRLAAPSHGALPGPQIRSDGWGLATVLDHIARNSEDDYRSIQESLRSIVPSVKCIRTPRARIIRTEKETTEVENRVFTESEEKEYSGNAIEFDMEGAPGIPAHMASEGTLLVLGLLTVLMGPTHPRLVLLDDLDRALHPRAQRDLVALLRRILDHNPDLQIVATSHSPYLLDTFEPEEVRLTTLKDDGSVAIGRLDAHPKFEKWKDEMSPGEFWSLVGEQWVAEPGAREKV